MPRLPGLSILTEERARVVGSKHAHTSDATKGGADQRVYEGPNRRADNKGGDHAKNPNEKCSQNLPAGLEMKQKFSDFVGTTLRTVASFFALVSNFDPWL
jgi:hypothetical protein